MNYNIWMMENKQKVQMPTRLKILLNSILSAIVCYFMNSEPLNI